MQKLLLGQKIAFLVANGCNESDLVGVQKQVQALGADTRIVSMDQGLVSSWNEHGWGLNFAADQALNASLAADYSMLVVPGGQKSIEKLQLTAHTRRFIRGFYETGKPVCILNEAVSLLGVAEIEISEDLQKPVDVRDNLMVCELNNDTSPEVFSALSEFLQASLLSEQAVAA